MRAIYEPLPATRRKASADRADAVFVHDGEGYGLVEEVQCSNYACRDCGTWLQPSETTTTASAKGTSWRNPGTRQWSCPEHTTEQREVARAKAAGRASTSVVEVPKATAAESRRQGGGGPPKRGCAALRLGAAAWIVDTGANDDIADPIADSEGKILESWVPREKEVLEAVGKQVEVQEHGRVSIPHFGETNEALLVPNSPNCMAVGKRIRLLRYGFTWWPEDMGAMPPPQPGANWWIPNGDGS